MPGLDSLLIYIQAKYATLTALRNSITNMTTTINNEIQSLQTEINNREITNPQNVSKESHYHTSHTDFFIRGTILTTTIVDRILYKIIILHSSEKVIMSYRFKH